MSAVRTGDRHDRSRVEPSSRRILIGQPSDGLRPAPFPAFEGQDVSFVEDALDFHTRGGQPGRIPAVQLIEQILPNAALMVGSGWDGVVIDQAGKVVGHTTVFTGLEPGHVPDRSTLPPERPAIPALFVGFDNVWHNWYHWNVFALRRLALAARLLPAEVKLAVPEAVAGRPNWQEALDALGLGDRILALPPGRHPVGRMHMLVTARQPPTDIVYLRSLHSVLPTLDLPQARRIAVRRCVGARLDDAEQASVSAISAQLGFEEVDLSAHSFEEQRAMFAGAALVVAAHGAGLANLLHSRAGTRVLEINRRLDGESVIRPWFYQIAMMRGLTYASLDADAGQVTGARLATAIGRLLRTGLPRPSVRAGG